jgi:hypothetical protein
LVRERATDWHALASHTISPYRRREQTKTKHFIQKNEGICVGSLGLEFMRATSRYDFNHLTSRSLTISGGCLGFLRQLECLWRLVTVAGPAGANGRVREQRDDGRPGNLRRHERMCRRIHSSDDRLQHRLCCHLRQHQLLQCCPLSFERVRTEQWHEISVGGRAVAARRRLMFSGRHTLWHARNARIFLRAA